MATVGSSNISFTDLRTAYNAGGEDDATGDANLQSGSIKLADFRGASFTDDSSVPASGSISVNDDFAGKTFGSSAADPIEYTTDGFRAYTGWSSDGDDLYGTTAPSTAISGTTANRRVQLKSGQDGPYYRTMLIVPNEQSYSTDNYFLIVDRSDENAVDDAEMWFRCTAHSSFNLQQWGLVSKDYDKSWNTQMTTNNYYFYKHAGIRDRLAFHGAGFIMHPGSADHLVSDTPLVEPAWESGKTYKSASHGHSGSTTNYTVSTSLEGTTYHFHSIIGYSPGTQKVNTNHRCDHPRNERLQLFFDAWTVNAHQVYCFPFYRGNSIASNHGLKIKWYEKTLDVYIDSTSPYLVPQSGQTWDNSTSSSIGLNGIFAGMYITAVSGTGDLTTASTSSTVANSDHTQQTLINAFVGSIHTNRMTMYKERGTSSSPAYPIHPEEIFGKTSGNATITISGYLFWHLGTTADYTENTKILGPPHTVLPRFKSSTAFSSTESYTIKQWAFFIGDTTSAPTNTCTYDLRGSLPSGSPSFSYSLTYSAAPSAPSAGVYPGTNIYNDGYAVFFGNQGNAVKYRTMDLSNKRLMGKSIIGQSGRIIFHMRVGTRYRSDVQLIRLTVNGTTYNLGGTSNDGDGLGNYSNWRRGSSADDTYSAGDYSNFTSLSSSSYTSSSQIWNRLTSGKGATSSTGVSLSEPHLYFETGFSTTQRCLLVSPEISNFTTNTIILEYTAYGSNMGELKIGVEIT